VSLDGGATWSRRLMATGSDGIPAACCDSVATFDQFGNLFLVYLNDAGTDVILAMSTDDGQTFSQLTTIDSGNVDKPKIATWPGNAAGEGRVWVTWQGDNGLLSARGAPVTGLDLVGSVTPAAQAPVPGGGVFG